jgi:hypothetical protein
MALAPHPFVNGRPPHHANHAKSMSKALTVMVALPRERWLPVSVGRVYRRVLALANPCDAGLPRLGTVSDVIRCWHVIFSQAHVSDADMLRKIQRSAT